MSSQKIASTRVDTAEGSVSWTFEDGTTRTVRLADLPPAIVTIAALDRIRAKATDCYAAAADQKDPVEWAIEQHDAVIEALRDGDWNRGGSVAGMVYEAIAAAMQQPLATVVAAFNAIKKEAREAKLKEIRKHPAFKKEYTRLQAERAAKKAKEAGPLEF